MPWVTINVLAGQSVGQDGPRDLQIQPRLRLGDPGHGPLGRHRHVAEHQEIEATASRSGEGRLWYARNPSRMGESSDC